MEEENKIQRPLMSEEEFEQYLKEVINNSYSNFFDKGILSLESFNGVGKVRSIRREIRKGNATITGIVCPSRPHNNRGNSCKRKGKHSRSMNERKKKIYEQLRRKDK